MADRELKFETSEDIIDALSKTIGAAKPGDRLILSMDQAITMQQSFVELQEDLDAAEDSATRKPVFFHVPEQGLYFQPSMIALTKIDPAGNAMLMTTSGAVLQVEALQWQFLKKHFEDAIELVRIPATSGSRVVSA